MATLPPPVALFLSFLFLLTLSRARDLQNPFPQPKPQSEPVNHRYPELKHQSHDTVSFTIDTIDPVPLTFLRFRPINRRFQPDRPLPLSLRAGHRRCRHGHRLQIPYGNDAIVLDDATSRRIHPRWVTAHAAAETRFPATVERLDSVHDHRHRGENHHHRHHREQSWFAKNFRKFMSLF